MARVCEDCGREAKSCANGDDRPVAVHEHEYDEWFCRKCWDGYAGEQGNAWHDVVSRDESDFGCEGHESLDGAHMGEAVYCDGSCRVVR